MKTPFRETVEKYSRVKEKEFPSLASQGTERTRRLLIHTHREATGAGVRAESAAWLKVNPAKLCKISHTHYQKIRSAYGKVYVRECFYAIERICEIREMRKERKNMESERRKARVETCKISRKCGGNLTDSRNRYERATGSHGNTHVCLCAQRTNMDVPPCRCEADRPPSGRKNFSDFLIL